MTKMLKAVAIAALTVFGSANAALINKVDLFSIDQALISDNFGTGGTSVSSQVGSPADNSIAPNIGTILGGFRELIVDKRSDGTVGGINLNRSVNMGVSGGQLDFSTSSQTTGTGIIRWDGVALSPTGGPASTIAFDGLGGVNLGNVLTDQFELKTVFSDGGFVFRIEAYTFGMGGTQWSAIDIVSNQHLVPTVSYVPLDAFLACGYMDATITVTCAGGGVDFSNLGALQAIIDPMGTFVSLDLTLDQVTVVPEPSGIALVGLALLGLGVTARRRKV